MKLKLNQNMVICGGFVITVLILLFIYKKEEHFCGEITKGPPMFDQNLLRKLYARIHGLEKLARNQIAQNNSIPYEKLDLQDIEQEINRTKQLINKIIHARTLPYAKQPLYNTGPHTQIIGLPSVPGTLYPEYWD